MRLEQVVRALGSGVGAGEDAVAKRLGGYRAQSTDPFATAEALLDFLFAVRFARSRSRPNLEPFFTYMRDSLVPKALRPSVAQCQRPVWSPWC